MEHLGALQKECLSAIAITVPLDIIVKVLGSQMSLVLVQKGILFKTSF